MLPKLLSLPRNEKVWNGKYAVSLILIHIIVVGLVQNRILSRIAHTKTHQRNMSRGAGWAGKNFLYGFPRGSQFFSRSRQFGRSGDLSRSGESSILYFVRIELCTACRIEGTIPHDRRIKSLLNRSEYNSYWDKQTVRA
jgi:hypothetical protein